MITAREMWLCTQYVAQSCFCIGETSKSTITTLDSANPRYPPRAKHGEIWHKCQRQLRDLFGKMERNLNLSNNWNRTPLFNFQPQPFEPGYIKALCTLSTVCICMNIIWLYVNIGTHAHANLLYWKESDRKLVSLYSIL